VVQTPFSLIVLLKSYTHAKFTDVFHIWLYPWGYVTVFVCGKDRWRLHPSLWPAWQRRFNFSVNWYRAGKSVLKCPLAKNPDTHSICPTGEMDTVTAKIGIPVPGEKRTLTVLPVASGSTGEVVPCDVYISRNSLNKYVHFVAVPSRLLLGKQVSTRILHCLPTSMFLLIRATLSDHISIRIFIKRSPHFCYVWFLLCLAV